MTASAVGSKGCLIDGDASRQAAAAEETDPQDGRALAWRKFAGDNAFVPPRASQHLTFRPLSRSDAPALLAVFSDPVAMRFLPAARRQDLAQMHRVIATWERWERDLGYSPWAICRRETGELLGDAGLLPYDGRGPDVEVVGHLLIRRWTRALVTEAAVAVLDFAFGDLRLREVVAAVTPGHAVTQRVLAALGFTARRRGPLPPPLSGHMEVFALRHADWGRHREQLGAH